MITRAFSYNCCDFRIRNAQPKDHKYTLTMYDEHADIWRVIGQYRTIKQAKEVARRCTY